MSTGLPTGLQRWANDARYEIRGRLGAGAMGTVLDAVHGIMGRPVAIKVIPKPAREGDSAEESEELVRFRREARAQARLSHPAIAQIYDYGEDEQVAWIVMERIDGGSLRERLERGGALPPDRAVALIGLVLDALAVAHAEGLIHRDIKPANIMLTASGQPKLVDFGVAWTTGSDLTQTGMLVGTPAYMPPEVYLGEPADARADLWAVGIVLYQLLTGTRPFSGGPGTMMRQVLEVEPPPPSSLCREPVAPLDGIVRRALAKRPAERWQDAASFAAALREAVRDVGVPAKDEPPAQPATQPVAPAEADTILVSGAEMLGMEVPAAPPPLLMRRWVWAAAGIGYIVLVLGVARLAPRPDADLEAVAKEPPRSDFIPTQAVGCSVWAKAMHPGQTATWSGPCVDGKGSGPGVLDYAVLRGADDEPYRYHFTGTLRGGKADGPGQAIKTYPSVKAQTTYDGEFRDGEFDGDGTWRSQRGLTWTKYKGHFKAGEYDGQGLETSDEGLVRGPSWHQGKLNGTVVYRLPDRYDYQGGMTDGMYDGRGSWAKSFRGSKTRVWTH